MPRLCGCGRVWLNRRQATLAKAHARWSKRSKLWLVQTWLKYKGKGAQTEKNSRFDPGRLFGLDVTLKALRLEQTKPDGFPRMQDEDQTSCELAQLLEHAFGALQELMASVAHPLHMRDWFAIFKVIRDMPFGCKRRRLLHHSQHDTTKPHRRLHHGP